MGRKAKLKKIRREMASQEPSEPEVNSEPTNFVNQLEKQGYQLDQAERCPELPEQRKNPQL
ncbi:MULTISPECIES: hypothetical protein [unclassified Coleofasciculus]|uniref:hypothetical protein n=1 Tax=unclassified Coleofasciculus TaxID=2692782 RepID=UPI00187E4EEF|nr:MULTISPECIES: hypothetical protein [unclassified Coleofasciculus]MBE9127329.1 hypothetical protein [Coleofasciculus sp. LEGE 07081]MBE9150911.1 hypothetical protein [Coleofasciculus sp. LEGE 07092]